MNHYKVPKIVRRGRFHSLIWEECPESVIFKLTVRNLARGASVAPVHLREQRKASYTLRAIVYLGAGERGDGDNFWKVIGDSLTFAGIIHSDAAVKDWHMYVRRDRENPRTVITVTRQVKETE